METAGDCSYGELQYWDRRYTRQLATPPAQQSEGVISPEGLGQQSEADGLGGGTGDTFRENGENGHEAAAVGDALKFDWLCGFEDLRPLLLHLLRPDSPLGADCPPSANEACSPPSPSPTSAKEADCPLAASGSGGSVDTSGGSNSIYNLVAELKRQREEGESRTRPAPDGLRAAGPSGSIQADRLISDDSELTNSLSGGSDGILGNTRRGISTGGHSGGRLSVLDLGAGNSQLMESLSRELPCIAAFALDYSAKAFECMREAAALGGRKCGTQQSARPHRSGRGSEPIVADARSLLPLRPGCIDLVIDKGCLDAVLNGWDQEQLHARWGRQRGTATAAARGVVGSGGQGGTATASAGVGEAVGGSAGCNGGQQDAVQSARAVLEQVHRLLVPGGRFCIVSYEPPAGRSWLLGRAAATGRTTALAEGAAEAVEGAAGWRVLACGFEHVETGNYVYILEKV